jgi:hypothetical protein
MTEREQLIKDAHLFYSVGTDIIIPDEYHKKLFEIMADFFLSKQQKTEIDKGKLNGVK